MYSRLGSIVKSEIKDQKGPFLKNEDGSVYKVNFVVAFVWERLDGQTSLDEIDKQMQLVTKDDSVSTKNISKNVVAELEKIDLVKEIPVMN